MCAAGVYFAATNAAWAYVDPGTGSMLLHAVIAGIAAGLFTIKVYWRKLKSFFHGGSVTEDDTSPSD